MLNFYANRGGKNLPAERQRALSNAKTELRRLYDRPVASGQARDRSHEIQTALIQLPVDR